MAATSCLLLLLAALAAAARSPAYVTDSDRLPGWKGELPSPPQIAEAALPALQLPPYVLLPEEDLWRGPMLPLSWEPRVFLLRDFLTPQECSHLITVALHNLTMTKSGALGKYGQEAPDSVRTSSGVWVPKRFDSVVSRIEKRVAAVTHLPIDNQEELEVLRYSLNQKFGLHTDWLGDDAGTREEIGGQRVATVVMYLAEPESGGETVFPEVADELRVSRPGWSECAQGRLAVKPKKGDAVLFYSIKPNGEVDHDSVHASCPALAGQKWAANICVRAGNARAPTRPH